MVKEEKKKRRQTTVSFNMADLGRFDDIKDKLPSEIQNFSAFVHDCFNKGLNKASLHKGKIPGLRPGQTGGSTVLSTPKAV